MAEGIINIETLKRDVENLYRKHLVARITFRGVTPWWGGDYEGCTSRWIDEDEIAGRLRWFLRTVYNRFCANNLNNYSESEEQISQILGSTSGRSLYSFKVRDVKWKENDSYRELERVNKLVARGKNKDPDCYSPINVEGFTLEILRASEDGKYDEVVVGGLLITLAFLGVGKGVTRGFGRFVPESCINISSELCEPVKNGKVKEAFEAFYSLFKASFKGITDCSKTNSWLNSAVPLAPLTEDGPDSIKETQCTTDDVIRALNVIQRSVMKSTFKTDSYGMKINDPGPFIHTWVFGLPRHSKVPSGLNQERMDVNPGGAQINKDKVKKSPFMGYLELRKDQQGMTHLVEPRRQSMFVISPVRESSKYKIYVIPFLSLKDNEKEVKVLVHKGIHANTGTIHLAPVSDVLNGRSLYNDEKSLAIKRKELSYGSVEEIIKNYGSELVKAIDKACQAVHAAPGRGGGIGGPKRPARRH